MIPCPTWRKGLLTWFERDVLYASVAFTWELPTVRRMAYRFPKIVVGGPAVESMPDYFADMPQVTKGESIPGMLQRFNPQATRTSMGCMRRCSFCSAWRREGGLRELPDWPDLPVVVDNNLLGCSQEHFDKVIGRLKVHGWADFNQGIDARLLTDYHAGRIAEVGKVIVRLALDSMKYADKWEAAFECLRRAGIAKSNIRSYAIIGESTGTEEAWDRCNWIEEHGALALPMWFHELNAMEHNRVTELQTQLGWNDFERRRIMKYFYWHQEITA